MPSQLSEEELLALRLGKLARDLVAHPCWEAFSAGVRDVQTFYTVRALAKGETEFEKGAVFGLSLVLRLPHDTIETRDEVLAAHRDYEEEVGLSVSPKEQAP